MASDKAITKAAIEQLVEMKRETPSRWNNGHEELLQRLIKQLGAL